MSFSLALVAGFGDSVLAGTPHHSRHQAEDEVAGLRDFVRAFRSARRPAGRLESRREALAALRGENVGVVEALLDAMSALEDDCHEIERDRGDYLEEGEPDYLLQPRIALDPLRGLQLAIGERLLAVQDAAARRVAFERALGDAKLPLTLRVRLTELADAGDVETIVKSLRSRHPDDLTLALRAVAVRAHASDEFDGHVERATKLLDHDAEAVRESAALALAAIATPECVEPLVKRLALERGRPRQRIVLALQRLTRQPIGNVPEAWFAWWNDRRDAVLAGELELGGGETVRTDGDHERYHDIPIDGDSILYVIDCSRSMNKKLEGTTTLPDGRVVRDRRIFRAKQELVLSLRSLASGKRFNVVAFGEAAIAFDEEPVEATEDNIEAATEWIAQLGFQNATAMYDGLDLAFRLGGRPERDVLWEPTFDTLFVLTDGVPTVNPEPGIENIVFDDPNAIVEATKRWNPLGRIVVHSIALGDEAAEEFLGRLAAENGGRFVQEN